MSPKDKSDGFTFASCKELWKTQEEKVLLERSQGTGVYQIGRDQTGKTRDSKNDLTYDYEIPGLIAYRPRHKFLYSRTQLTY